MTKILALSALPVLALLAACGPDNDITVTNDSNVVLNDQQTGYASTNDGELPANATGPMGDPMVNGADPMTGNSMDGGAMAGNMSNAM